MEEEEGGGGDRKNALLWVRGGCVKFWLEICAFEFKPTTCAVLKNNNDNQNNNKSYSLQVCSNHNETWDSDCALYQMRCLCTEDLEDCELDKYKHVHIDYYGPCKGTFDSFISVFLYYIFLTLPFYNRVPGKHLWEVTRLLNLQDCNFLEKSKSTFK